MCIRTTSKSFHFYQQKKIPIFCTRFLISSTQTI